MNIFIFIFKFQIFIFEKKVKIFVFRENQFFFPEKTWNFHIFKRSSKKFQNLLKFFCLVNDFSFKKIRKTFSMHDIFLDLSLLRLFWMWIIFSWISIYKYFDNYNIFMKFMKILINIYTIFIKFWKIFVDFIWN